MNCLGRGVKSELWEMEAAESELIREMEGQAQKMVVKESRKSVIAVDKLRSECDS